MPGEDPAAADFPPSLPQSRQICRERVSAQLSQFQNSLKWLEGAVRALPETTWTKPAGFSALCPDHGKKKGTELLLVCRLLGN